MATLSLILINIIVVCICLIKCTSGIEGRQPSVSLTVKGGVSLASPLCPGTLELYCEGMDFTLLRWSYDSTNSIISFDTTDIPFSMPLSHPAFEKAELLSVTPAQDDRRFAMFTSILTVNLRQLQEQRVRNISCGAPGTVESIVVPANISFLQPTTPEMPIITGVTANYQLEKLSNITVSWKKLEVCPEFEESLYHELTLTGLEPVRVNQTSCGDTLCKGTISNIPIQGNRYGLSLKSHNNLGSSGTYDYPSSIEQQSEVYFKTGLSWTDCQAEVQCESAGGLNSNASCTVQFGIESQNFSIKGEITATINVPFAIRELSPGITYRFQFSVPVSDTLLIVNTGQLSTNTNMCSSSQAATSAVFIIVLITVLSLIQLMA